MRRWLCSLAAVAVLTITWLGPLPSRAAESFAVHMTLHMALVAIAAPLVALAIAGSPIDPIRRWPRLFAAIPASMAELVVVWAWHAPAWHEAARHDAFVWGLEQLSFAAAGLWLWIAALGGSGEQRRSRAGAGVVALLFTSMHMTLLGALFGLANRPLFHTSAMANSLSDQHLGGVIMLLVGGAAYLAGGVMLTATALRDRCSPRPVAGPREAGA